jgi:hypothetical protein
MLHYNGFVGKTMRSLEIALQQIGHVTNLPPHISWKSIQTQSNLNNLNLFFVTHLLWLEKLYWASLVTRLQMRFFHFKNILKPRLSWCKSKPCPFCISQEYSRTFLNSPWNLMVCSWTNYVIWSCDITSWCNVKNDIKTSHHVIFYNPTSN